MQPNILSSRRAFTLIEILIAMMFLAVATGFALRVHQSSSEYDRLATDHLRAQLIMENLAEELRVVPYEELEQTISELADKAEAEIKINPVEANSRSGKHVRFQMNLARGTFRHHLWRWEPVQ